MSSSIYTLCCFYMFFQSSSSDKKDKSIVIVGAGAAGIAAASKLLENDFENIHIIEAENRIGGRVHSVHFKENIIELGAEHCHGEKGNIVFDLVKNYDALESEDETPQVFHSVYKQLSNEFTKNFYKLYHSLYSQDKISNETLGGCMMKRYNHTLKQIFENEEDQKLAVEGIDLIEKWVLGNDGTFSWLDSSAEIEFVECEGDQELSWKKNGYKTIFDVLMKRYPNDNNTNYMENKIFLNKVVNKVDWSNKNKIVVTCADGSIFSCDHVITTMSLGVLKHQHSNIFYPLLPEKKVKSIEAFGIGAVAKVFLYFPNKWWSNDDLDFTFMWTSADIQSSFKEFSEGPHKKNVSWVTNLIGLHQVQRNPNVLLAWFLGTFIPDIERCNEETIINGVMFALNKFVGFKYNNISRPTELKRFNWYLNPHFQGSYSFETVKSRQMRVAQDQLLAEPVLVFDKPTLLFAGEATHPYHYATVHGAIESGFREADRIIKFYDTS
ncbi:hypothetical protein FQR65_LT13676 [Abscondita terminalis]|nr:hypothetical protein FQR65_LT13676 [Abscondita terminalis]